MALRMAAGVGLILRVESNNAASKGVGLITVAQEPGNGWKMRDRNAKYALIRTSYRLPSPCDARHLAEPGDLAAKLPHGQVHSATRGVQLQHSYVVL